MSRWIAVIHGNSRTSEWCRPLALAGALTNCRGGNHAGLDPVGSVERGNATRPSTTLRAWRKRCRWTSETACRCGTGRESCLLLRLQLRATGSLSYVYRALRKDGRLNGRRYLEAAFEVGDESDEGGSLGPRAAAAALAKMSQGLHPRLPRLPPRLVPRARRMQGGRAPARALAAAQLKVQRKKFRLQ